MDIQGGTTAITGLNPHLDWLFRSVQLDKVLHVAERAMIHVHAMTRGFHDARWLLASSRPMTARDDRRRGVVVRRIRGRSIARWIGSGSCPRPQQLQGQWKVRRPSGSMMSDVLVPLTCTTIRGPTAVTVMEFHSGDRHS